MAVSGEKMSLYYTITYLRVLSGYCTVIWGAYDINMHKVQQRRALIEADATEHSASFPGKQDTTPMCTQIRYPGSQVPIPMDARLGQCVPAIYTTLQTTTHLLLTI